MANDKPSYDSCGATIKKKALRWDWKTGRLYVIQGMVAMVRIRQSKNEEQYISVKIQQLNPTTKKWGTLCLLQIGRLDMEKMLDPNLRELLPKKIREMNIKRGILRRKNKKIIR